MTFLLMWSSVVMVPKYRLLFEDNPASWGHAEVNLQSAATHLEEGLRIQENSYEVNTMAFTFNISIHRLKEDPDPSI